MNCNWSARKQRLHPQSVAEISRHSVLSGDRIQQCLGLASRTQISDCKSPFPSTSTAVSLFHAKTVQQRPLLPREVKTRLPDCGVTHYVRIDHLSRLPVMRPSKVNSVDIKSRCRHNWKMCALPPNITGASKLTTQTDYWQPWLN